MSKRMIINMLAVMVILLGGVSYSVAGGVSPQIIHIHVSACSGGGTDCYCEFACHTTKNGCYCADY